MRNDFAVFVLSHGRSNNVKTVKSLLEQGYTGKWYIILDDEDGQLEQYRANYGDDKIKVFCKQKYKYLTDSLDNTQDSRTPLYARNASFDIAKEEGLQYFCEMDDDYGYFAWRYPVGKVLKSTRIASMDEMFDTFIEFMEGTPTKSIAMAQAGDFIGGVGSKLCKDGMLGRKAMNSFMCNVNRRFWFRGTMNDDVNTYITLGSTGDLFFTNGLCALNQEITQVNSGGITELYKDNGTYQKSFYSVITMPSCVNIITMGWKNRRIHHQIDWDCCVPKIIREEYKKNKE